MQTIRARLTTIWRRVAWFVNGVVGANKYQQYLAHHRRHGCGEPLTEREFWRAEYDRQGRQISSRCC